jgi:hypothetical protein
VVDVLVETTEDPALDEEESTFVEADTLGVGVKYDCVDRKLNMAAGVDVKYDGVNTSELDVAAAMVAAALRSVATTSVLGIRYHWCHLQAYWYMPWTSISLIKRP